MTGSIKIKTALISVSDKQGLLPFAKALTQMGIKIISTGGTAKALLEAGIPYTLVADVTQFPEIMQGRVKTLHPKIHGGILGKRDHHQSDAAAHEIEWIDMVVCNLYPFAATLKSGAPHHEIIENIDIGGPAMIRAAAKNLDWVTCVCDPADYESLMQALTTEGAVPSALRKNLAAKAFSHTAGYDSLIAQYLSADKFPASLNLSYQRQAQLRYGENPHQAAAVYVSPNGASGVLAAEQKQGKELSYNNIVDADAALRCVQEFIQPACVIVKHANPCGVAVAESIDLAFTRAWEADAKSAFGGIIALNRPCTLAIAEQLAKVFVEVIIAPGFAEGTAAIFAKKPNCRILDIGALQTNAQTIAYKFIHGGLLVQDADIQRLDSSQLQFPSSNKPDQAVLEDLLFSWQVAKHLKSNAIIIARQQTTIGIGAGQVSRIDAVELAIKKASQSLTECVLASDGFFPFRDSIDQIAKTGIKSIIQPGGSLRDNEVIEACNEHGIAMVFTGIRCFNH